MTQEFSRHYENRSVATCVVAASNSLHPERADYVCSGVNDQVQIQAAVDALPSGGGKVTLMDGLFNVWRLADSIYTAIRLSDNTEFEMNKGTIIRLADGQNCSVISNSDFETGNLNIYVHGGKIDGNKTNQSEYTPAGDDLPDKTGHGIQFRHVWGSHIDGVYIVDTMFHSIMVWKWSYNNIVENCLISNPGKAGGSYDPISAICLFYYVDNNHIKNNILLNSNLLGDQPALSRGLYPSVELENNRIDGNIVDGFRQGLAFSSDLSNHNVIVDNTFNVIHTGIAADNGGLTTGTYNLIAQNTIKAATYGIYLDTIDHWKLLGNTVVISSGTGIRIGDGTNFDACHNTIIAGTPVSLTSVSGDLWEDNIGYITKAHGSSTGTGAQQTIAHGLAATPTKVMLWNIEAASHPYQSAAADGTNIKVTAANNQDWGWEAEV